MKPWCLYHPDCGGKAEWGCEECPCIGMEYEDYQLELDIEPDEPTAGAA
jgi:hypothetical protein